MTVLALLGVVLVLFVAAVLSTREGPVMADAAQDVADVPLPEGTLTAPDLAGIRFGMAPRGYRMSEVDAVLERLGAELADRDRRLALLDATVEGETAVHTATEADLPVAPVQPLPAAQVRTPESAVPPAPAVSVAPVPGTDLRTPAPGRSSLTPPRTEAEPPPSVAQAPVEPAPLPDRPDEPAPEFPPVLPAEPLEPAVPADPPPTEPVEPPVPTVPNTTASAGEHSAPPRD